MLGRGAGDLSGLNVPVREQQEENADRHSRVGDVEDKPSRELEAADGDVEEIHVKKIDHLAVEQRAFTEEEPVEHPVDEVADRAREDQREGKPDGERMVADVVEVPGNGDGGEEGEQGEDQLAVGIDPEGHAGILDERQAKEITEERDALSELQPFMIDPKDRDGESLDEQF